MNKLRCDVGSMWGRECVGERGGKTINANKYVVVVKEEKQLKCRETKKGKREMKENFLWWW